VTAERRLVIGREEILRPPPRTLAFDHRIDGDVADPDLFHFVPLKARAHRNGSSLPIQAALKGSAIYAEMRVRLLRRSL
jgi:hypothetical protein